MNCDVPGFPPARIFWSSECSAVRALNFCVREGKSSPATAKRWSLVFATKPYAHRSFVLEVSQPGVPEGTTPFESVPVSALPSTPSAFFVTRRLLLGTYSRCWNPVASATCNRNVSNSSVVPTTSICAKISENRPDVSPFDILHVSGSLIFSARIRFLATASHTTFQTGSRNFDVHRSPSSSLNCKSGMFSAHSSKESPHASGPFRRSVLSSSSRSFWM
mmetsp:Transcript_4938/g.18351  ORF Transcript_4938/g.18351 Transcript_4938/m.18351 type:complete len:219 (+) Transcript_4938:1677-2333(+)